MLTTHLNLDAPHFAWTVSVQLENIHSINNVTAELEGSADPLTCGFVCRAGLRILFTRFYEVGILCVFTESLIVNWRT